ncbi:MAG TPA: choline ABC transporter substrate-binding protein [Alphaproteobacteria bacterium]|nr:choline ABC transporter substrate-binding protein [Alphaproteobacteria bacterium]
MDKVLMKRLLCGTAILAASAAALPASAADPEACRTVRFADPGWTDILSTVGLTTVMLEGLGYETTSDILAVPVTFVSLKNGDADVFLGNWMPAQQSFIDEYTADNSIEVVGVNLEGAKFTLAVPDYVHEAGVTDFADLAEHADEFDREIYGIEPGAPGNQLLQRMVQDMGLDGWEVVESSEQGMLSQVSRAVNSEDWIVFLAWAPHPMNLNFDIEYLTGGDEYFGPDFGGATVYTAVRQGYLEECPNVAQLLENLKFTVEMENQLMALILDEGMEPQEAARQWLAENPGVLDQWLEGAQTVEGEEGLPAVKEELGL